MTRTIGLSRLSAVLLVIMTFSAGSLMGAWIQSDVSEPTQSAALLRTNETVPSDQPDSSPLIDPNLVTFTNGFRPLVQRTMPAVVSVTSSRTVESEVFGSSPFATPFFREFFGEGFRFGDEFQLPQEREQQGQGSGVIVDPRGYVLTNEHVVRDASEVKVYLSDDREFEAEIVGTDPKTDIAVLKIDAEDLAYLPVGDSSTVEVGDFALAIGSPFGLNHTVTMGIISAVGRGDLGIEDYEDFIQTDAAINPGNSGGALINVRGELIGINTAIMSRGGGGNQGVGFAVPSHMAMAVMDQILTQGRVVRGWLGVTIQPVSAGLARAFDLPDARGALVGDVMPQSPADEAGVRDGDVITALNGQPIEDTRALRLKVAMMAPGTEAILTVYRDNREVEIPVTLGELEDGTDALTTGPSTDSPTGLMEGVAVQDLTPQLRRQFELDEVDGVIVANVGPSSDAYEAGLREGDLIQEVNREAIANTAEYRTAINQASDDSILLRVYRNGASMYLVVEP